MLLVLLVLLKQNITGITPALFILNGKNDEFALYVPVLLFEYCIGILLSASCTYTTPTIIAIYNSTEYYK